MDLVEEEDRRAAAVARALDHRADLGAAGLDRAVLLEGGAGGRRRSIRASVVLPEPGGPCRIIECSRPLLERAAQRRVRRRAAPAGRRPRRACAGASAPRAGRRRGSLRGSSNRRSHVASSILRRSRWARTVSDGHAGCARGPAQRGGRAAPRLIRFDTVNPPGDERAAQEHLAACSSAAGFACELLGRTHERPNLVARLDGEAPGPTLCLLSHVDTVLATPSEWTPRPVVGRPRRRLRVGPRRARHEVADRGRGRRRPARSRARAGGPRAARCWSSRSSTRRPAAPRAPSG